MHDAGISRTANDKKGVVVFLALPFRHPTRYEKGIEKGRVEEKSCSSWVGESVMVQDHVFSHSKSIFPRKISKRC